MGISLVVAVTDSDWFEMLRHRADLAEVNFWAPSAANFRALQPGELFLFKLHSPRNFIVGGGIFTYANTLPVSLAWEAFGESNGATSLRQMRERIQRYRKAAPDDRTDFPVGNRILTQPFFFDEPVWIPVPSNWSKNIVSFKTYNTDEPDGLRLWEAVTDRMVSVRADMVHDEERYGTPRLVRPRLGQGAFRVLVKGSSAYGAVTPFRLSGSNSGSWRSPQRFRRGFYRFPKPLRSAGGETTSRTPCR